MGSEFIDNLAASPWAPVLAAYIFGVATGWLIWGGHQDDEQAAIRERIRERAAEDPDSVDADAENNGRLLNIDSEAPDAMKYGAIESELRNARELLLEQEEDKVKVEQSLGELDDSIKRANGRLKLLIGAVKKAASQSR